MITPVEIENVKFGKQMRGYDVTEVETFLNDMMESFEVLYKENLELKDTIAALEEKVSSYKAVEDTLKDTLVLAQKTGEEIRGTAEEKAKVIIRESEAQAAQMVEQANQEVFRIRLQKEDAVRDFGMFKVKVEGMLQAQLRALESITEEKDVDAKETQAEEIIRKIQMQEAKETGEE